MELSVKDVPEKEQYEVRVEGQPAGLARYQIRGRRINVFHTELDPAYGGHGISSALARGVLDDVRRRDRVLARGNR